MPRLQELSVHEQRSQQRNEDMSKSSTKGKTARKSAVQIPAATAGDLKRLRAAMSGKIDISEIAERREFHRLRRDANGRLPRSPTQAVKKPSAKKKAS